MSGIPVKKNMYKSKFTGCKSILPLRGQYLVVEPFYGNDCYEYLWVGLYQLCTVRW